LREGAYTGPETSVEKLGVGIVRAWLKLAHIDPVLTDKGFDLLRAHPGVLIGADEPVIDRMRFEPVVERAMRLAFVGRLAVVHELLDQLA
jgi:hypothetical protein